MRYSEIRLLRWQQIDFAKRELRVGHAKTEHGEGASSRLARAFVRCWNFGRSASRISISATSLIAMALPPESIGKAVELEGICDRRAD